MHDRRAAYGTGRQVISARLRLVNLQAAVLTLATGRHRYLSTACLHGQHHHCRSWVNRDDEPKVPGTCKFDRGEVCICPVCNHGGAT